MAVTSGLLVTNGNPVSEGGVVRIPANGIEINAEVTGSGPAVLLLHGFPHTWRLWTAVIPHLARHHRVIAPDLRGLGATTRADGGYDAGTLAADAEALLDALDEPTATVVGIDAGTPPAFLLAMRRPERVRRLVVMESLLGRLPGAEEFLAGGPPWWFGFHAVPGLPETVLAGHEADYIGWFAHYRAMPESAGQIAAAVAAGRLTVPTTAIGAHPVGDTLARQLRPIADDLTSHVVEDCGHIIPLDRPDALVPLLAVS
jgi:pimeloyl-ACP methyl ester carboxylesterase